MPFTKKPLVATLLGMRKVGIKTLKNQLSEYVRAAAGGEIVLVTDRDRVVAELIAPRSHLGGLHADKLLTEAVRAGWITPASVTEGVPPATPLLPFDVVMEDLRRDRADR
jgi:antitoxin (DNA-binding transcriptional repressor) of toxin-antitoxin stability system